MNTDKHRWIWMAAALLIACNAFAGDVDERSTGEKIALIDMGSSWKSPKESDIKRCDHLIKELATRYGVTEIQVADAAVTATHTLLKNKYGIEQKIQDTLEGVYKAKKIKGGKQGMDEMFVLYVLWMDQNQ